MDMIVVLSKSLKFFSLSQRSLFHEIMIRDLFLESFSQIQNDWKELMTPNNNSLRIIDAAIYKNGILILLGVFSTENQCYRTDFYLGFNL